MMPDQIDMMNAEELRTELKNTIKKNEKRLDWIQRHISGKELRRLGIVMVDSSDKKEFIYTLDSIISA